MEYHKLQSVLGKKCVFHALSQTAHDFSVGFFANPINHASYPRFIQANMQSKHMDINLRTEKSGVLGGLIASENVEGTNLTKPVVESIGSKKAYAVRRGEKEIYVHSPSTTDQPIRACCYPSGVFVTTNPHLNFMHNKWMWVDETILVNGSANWSRLVPIFEISKVNQ